ncbi:rRNA N-glycosidase [Hordeum vulgare]|nr:rRNA N-glycosidase [Hordeum vulgare]
MHGRRHVHSVTPTPSPSSPPPPLMTEEEEAEFMRHVMEDSMNTHDERQWVGLETAFALSTAGDVIIPELDLAAVVKEEVVDESPLAAWNPQLLG